MKANPNARNVDKDGRGTYFSLCLREDKLINDFLSLALELPLPGLPVLLNGNPKFNVFMTKLSAEECPEKRLAV
jgi:hypothetical protein